MAYKAGKVTFERSDIEYTVAQLRHLYSMLSRDTIKNQPMVANGLVSPLIKQLEKGLNDQNPALYQVVL